MTDLKKSEKHSEPSAGKTVVRLALYVDVPVDLPEGCELETLTADDGKTTIGIPSPDSLLPLLTTIAASDGCKSVAATFGAATHMIKTAHPDFAVTTDQLVGFTE